MTLFELFDGETIKSGSGFLNSSNRAFRYGDGLFETIKVVNSSPLFVNDHYERMTHGMRILHINHPDFFDLEFFTKQVEKLLSLNQMKNARIRMVVFRNSTGNYRPTGDDMSWHLSCTELTYEQYKTDANGIAVGYYEENCKCNGNASSVKSLNGLLYILAGIAGRESGWDESLIINQNGNIIEASSSNLFVRKENSFITPPLSDGCLNGVLRKNLIRILKDNGLGIKEQSIVKSDLVRADELILTNVISGVQWVKKLGTQNYKGEFAPKLNEYLNRFTKL